MLAEPLGSIQSKSNWRAELDLCLQNRAGITRMIPQQRLGPLTVQRPFYPENETCHVYLLHPPGGVVGGDELQLKVSAQSHSHSVITTPGATKFYLSAGKTAYVQQHLNLAEHAKLEFLPLETIYFPGAKVHSETQIHLQQHSQLAFWEMHCFGRPANQEMFDQGDVTIKLKVFNELGLCLNERQFIDSEEIQRSCGMRGYAVLSNFIIASANIDEHLLEKLRQVPLATGIAGITRLDEHLLIIRALGDRTVDIFNYFKTLWAFIRPQAFEKHACIPRIWQT